jgi:type I restriction enzyme M protein
MPLSNAERNWYYEKIHELDPKARTVSLDRDNNLIVFNYKLRSDETNQREATPEELVHALAICMLIGNNYNYKIETLYHEKRLEHGRKGSLSDEVDLILYDDEGIPFALFEFKSYEEYDKELECAIKLQLFGTAPLVGTPKLLIYATIRPNTKEPMLTLICIDYTKFRTFDKWIESNRSASNLLPPEYQDLDYRPIIKDGEQDLRLDCTQAEFRSVATAFHNEFFGEHTDNVLFTNLVKCLLAKIFDEKSTKKGEPYKFQIFNRNGKEETAIEVYNRINNELYSPAYKRYIDPGIQNPDEINSKEFSSERVKIVVRELQSMSITRGSALHGDIIGAFFEEILRVGFKQDKGMYFTHDNLVYFMLEAVDLRGLTLKTWMNATHPENRLPYVIDPACGSGTFLLKAMRIITETVRENAANFIIDMESETFYNARMSESMPNYWAENFLYGLDPKFVMAITAKVNMVLHGDGSAHIFKNDAFKPLSTFSDNKFRPAGDSIRSVLKSRYSYDICETFDVVISNPPFGITLSSDTRKRINENFSLGDKSPSEALFLERCFQLLKPGGRMAIVIPESILNTGEAINTRLFLYRNFWIRAIVSLPRNVFIDTPTLTSLLFAQKKTAKEILEWDKAWAGKFEDVNRKIVQANLFLKGAMKNAHLNPIDIQKGILKILNPIVDEKSWVLKHGKNSSVITFSLPTHIIDANNAVIYYKDIIKLSGLNLLIISYIFKEIATKFNYEYPVFIVDEVGFKLSKRKERIRPNQLCRFTSTDESREIPNLHLANEPVKISIDAKTPQRVLDFMKKSVIWS